MERGRPARHSGDRTSLRIDNTSNEDNLMKTKNLLLSIALSLLLGASLLAALNIHDDVAFAHSANEPAAANTITSEINAQQTISTAYVVVRFGDNDTIVRPITFTEPISAYHALELSGLNFTTADYGWGLFICSIADVGDSSPTCDNGDRYWGTAQWNAATERWDGRMVGIADAMIVADGHVESFSWSDPSWTPVDPPPAPPLVAASNGLAWLETQQQADGSFGAPGNTAEVLTALGANRTDGRTWRQDGGLSLLSAMWQQSLALDDNAAEAGKLALALATQDTCWPFAALQPSNYYSATAGYYDVHAGPHALAMLGAAALGETIPASATTYLQNMQQPDGSWEWMIGIGGGPDTNSTAFALQALIAAGEAPTSTAVISGLTYLKQAQNADGGFPYDPDSAYGTASDTNSTATVLQALLAAGENPLSGDWATDDVTGTFIISGTNPVAYLLSMQLPDGSFEWQQGFGANQMATQQATIALLYRPYPVRSAIMSACETVFLPFVSRD